MAETIVMKKARSFKKGPRQRSGVWLHYRDSESQENITICNICHSTFKNHGSTTTLWHHLKYKHPNEYARTPRVMEEDANASAGLTQYMQETENPVTTQNYVVQVSNPAETSFWGKTEVSDPIHHSPPKKKRKEKRKESGVWNFMTKINPTQIQCRVCSTVFRYHGSTTSLWSHVKAKHPAELEDMVQGQGATFTVPAGGQQQDHDAATDDTGAAVHNKSLIQVKKEFGMKRVENRVVNNKPVTNAYKSDASNRRKLIDKAVTDMILLDLQPLGIVEQPGFKKLMQYLEPRYYIPSPDQIATNIMPLMYREEKMRLKIELQKVSHVTVTTELWATPVTEGFLTISVHYLDAQWKKCCAVLETCKITENHSTESIAEELNRIFTEWSLIGKITCVVIDNSANVDAAVQILRLPHLPCFAYTMDWIVQESLKNVSEILQVKKKVRDIASVFHHNDADREKLLALQKEHGRQPLKLKMDVESRWLSTFYMLERFVQLSDFIPAILYSINKSDLNLTDAELELVKHCVKTLEPFEVAVKEMTAEKFMPLSKVIPMTRAISQFVARTTESLGGDSSGLSTELELQMRQHFSGIEQNFLYGASTVVDPRFKKLPFSTTEALMSVENQLSEEIVINSGSELNPELNQNILKPDILQQKSKSLWSSFDQQVESTLSSTSVEQECKQEMSRYYEETLLQRYEEPFNWWSKMDKFLNKVSPMARKYLAIPATAIPADRLFLKDRDIVSQRRANLKDSVVNTVLFLNKNLS